MLADKRVAAALGGESARRPLAGTVPRTRPGHRGWSACACAAGLFLLSPAAFAQRLVVVASGDTPPYQQAIGGIQRLAVPAEALTLAPENEAAVTATLARVGRDSAVVTLGAAAAALAGRAAPPVPVVNCMLLEPDEPRPAGTSVRVPLDIPADIQVAWLRRLLPSVRNVGILFDPALNDRRARTSAAALSRHGYVPVLEPVTGPTALPNALAKLTNRVDVLHALPDTTVYTREHSRALLLFSFRHQIPLVAPTESWVKAGALYAIDWDYADLGRYCGALALAKLPGAKAAPPPPPRTRVVVNARSAEQLRIRWDAELLRSVDRVYE